MTRDDWDPQARRRPSGGAPLAGVLLLLVGVWQLFIGYAVASGEAFVFSGGGYWYHADNTAWGWVNLVIGAAAVTTGLAGVGAPGPLRRLRAKGAPALLVAVVSAMNQFFLAPQYPVWAALVIAVDVVIIWAVTTQHDHTGADRRDTEDRIGRLGTSDARSWHGGPMGGRSLVQAAKRFASAKRTDAAAALTYYSVLSIFPAVLVGASVIGMLRPGATQTLLDAARDIVPADAMSIIETAVDGLQTSDAAGVLAIVGLLLALWAASNWVAAFMRALNEVNATGETRKWWTVLIVRVVLTVVVGTLTVACALILATGGAIADQIGEAIGAGGTAVTIWAWIKWPIVLILVIVIVALLYWLAPAARSGFKYRAPGAGLAVILWIIASAGFGIYVANFSNYDKTYGTLGGVIVFLMWLWITNSVLLFGSEYNASAKPEPAENDEAAIG